MKGIIIDNYCGLQLCVTEDVVTKSMEHLIRRYCVIIYFGHFWPPGFCPIPNLYAKISAFYADIFIFVSHCSGNVRFCIPIYIACSVAKDDVRAILGQGWRSGARWWKKCLRKFERKIILGLDFLRQSEAGYRV